MNKISIIVDTTSDLNIETMKNKGIIFAPIGVEIDGTTYEDKVTIAIDDFYNKIRKKGVLPKTSLVSPSVFADLFNQELNKGNEVICITLSSKLSGTYNSANIAKEMIESEKIHIIDSKSVSLGAGMLALESEKLANEGKSVNVIIDELNNMIQKQECFIYIDDLEMLKRGGRIPAAIASIGSVLNIKPILTIKDGVLASTSKARGKKAALREIIRAIESTDIDDRYPIMMAHANNLEGIKELINLLNKDSIENNTIISEIGPAIGSHSGEGAIGIWCIKK